MTTEDPRAPRSPARPRFRGAVLAGGGLIALVGVGIALYARPLLVAHQDGDSPPPALASQGAPAPMDDALYDRTEGLRACTRQDWDECARRLHRAADQNPSYEQDPEIVRALADEHAARVFEEAKREEAQNRRRH